MIDRCAHCGTDGVHHCYAAEVARLRAALKAREAEVKYLRAHRAWERAAARAAGSGSLAVIPAQWLAEHPRPTPPEGVEP